MLELGVQVCNKIGIEEVLVACDKSNIASVSVIKICGGMLKEKFYSNTYGESIQMYVINSLGGQ